VALDLTQRHLHASRRLSRLRLTVALGVAVSSLTIGALGASGATTTTLPLCPSTSTWRVTPVSAPVKSALTSYYAARHLTPISIYRNRMWNLTLALETTGVHWCRNAGGGRSGYVGVVPKSATAAVLVQVTHRAYPVTGSRTTFATVVKLATGWKVVSDDTGP
jgi:hypothetical protein